ncbi:hypothetical protein GCM10009843_26140 [Nocardioides bigeumensis]|uniref:VanZ family protein n=1 Tax=Nocardioides bigeumensis TaxID=433657 RepID=A0ABP5K4E4_9ACTN
MWLLTAAYVALLGWILFAADKRFLRRIAVDVYTALGEGMPTAVRPAHYELALYVLLFIPLGWLALRATRRPMSWVAVGCVWAVVMAEFAQVALLDRRGSVVEVLAASFGAMLGTLVAQRAEDSRDRLR